MEIKIIYLTQLNDDSFKIQTTQTKTSNQKHFDYQFSSNLGKI